MRLRPGIGIFRVPDSLRDDVAVMTEIFAVTHSLERDQVHADSRHDALDFAELPRRGRAPTGYTEGSVCLDPPRPEERV